MACNPESLALTNLERTCNLLQVVLTCHEHPKLGLVQAPSPVPPPRPLPASAALSQVKPASGKGRELGEGSSESTASELTLKVIQETSDRKHTLRPNLHAPDILRDPRGQRNFRKCSSQLHHSPDNAIPKVFSS